MDIIGLKLSPYFKGESMLKESEARKCIVTEYMGPGCPDIIERSVWFSARDNDYLVAYKVNLFEGFDSGELCEVYDRKKDKKEYYNIVDKIDKNKIQYLLDEIKLRYDELSKDTSKYYDKLKSTESGIPINY